MTLRTVPLLAAILLGRVGPVAGQPPTPPSFEVASVKRNTTSDPGRQGALFREHINTTQGSVTLRNVTLKSCIKWAYDLQDQQIEGPGWLMDDRFDILAKSSGPASAEDLQFMLRALLAERFKLIARTERRTVSAIALLTGKDQPKLHQSDAGGLGALTAARGRIVAERTSMAQLAAALSDPLRLAVVDMTGLNGRYDFTLDFTSFAPQPGETPDETAITIAVVQRQLGLKLERRKMPLDILVVDSATRAPEEN
jgi:uncharacterized protein (TIGR03435 family)